MNVIDIDHFGDDIPLPEFNKDKTNQKPIKEGSHLKRKKVDHSKRTTDYWEKLGYRCDKLEGWQNVNGSWVKKDFLGFADFLATSRHSEDKPVLIQVCAKGDVRGHLRKMLGDDVIKGGESRRSAFNYYFSIGWLICIHWWDQPGGSGTSWVSGIEWVTQSVIDNIDSGKRMKRK